MAKAIALTRGFSTIVDDERFEELSQFKWFASGSVTTRIYAARRGREDGRNKLVTMHRIVCGKTSCQDIDHINGNTLDNRRCNLRPATRSQNIANRSGPSRAESGFYGVHRGHKKHQAVRWEARLHVNGRTIYLGRFSNPEEAARTRDRAALEAWGEFAKLNFPNEVAS